MAEERKAAPKVKMPSEEKIYQKGPERGNAAVYHLISGLIAHPEAKVSYGISALAAQYESRSDISRFIEIAHELGRDAVGSMDVECYELPVSGGWHLSHPKGRLALMDRAFSR